MAEVCGAYDGPESKESDGRGSRRSIRTIRSPRSRRTTSAGLTSRGGEGCLLAALLSADVSRQGPETRRVLTDGVAAAAGDSGAVCWNRFLEGGSPVGSCPDGGAWWGAGVTLARAVEDPALSDGFPQGRYRTRRAVRIGS